MTIPIPSASDVSAIAGSRAANPAPDLNWHTALLAANQALKQLATDVAAVPQGTDPTTVAAVQADWQAYAAALLDLHGRARKAVSAFEV